MVTVYSGQLFTNSRAGAPPRDEGRKFLSLVQFSRFKRTTKASHFDSEIPDATGLAATMNFRSCRSMMMSTWPLLPNGKLPSPGFRRSVPLNTGMAIGKDIWDGTVLVPGLAFDTTAPVIRGAITENVVAPGGVKGARVRYRLSALDETDGSLPVSCRLPAARMTAR